MPSALGLVLSTLPSSTPDWKSPATPGKIVHAKREKQATSYNFSKRYTHQSCPYKAVHLLSPDTLCENHLNTWFIQRSPDSPGKRRSQRMSKPLTDPAHPEPTWWLLGNTWITLTSFARHNWSLNHLDITWSQLIPGQSFKKCPKVQISSL